MTLLAAVGTFPTATCALVGVLNRALGLDVIGPLGLAILAAALLATVAAMVVVWRHPEGVAHSEGFE